MLEENGKLMRITRETLGYTYAQVEEATKVREFYLQLLENGDLAQMPGRIYAIGFADTYARFLGMDPAPILADVKSYYEVNTKQNSFEAYVSGKKVVQAMAEGKSYDPSLHDVKNKAQSRLQDQNSKADAANQLRAQGVSNGALGHPIRTRSKRFGRRFIWLVLGSVMVLLMLMLYLLQDNPAMPGGADDPQPPSLNNEAPIVLIVRAVGEDVWMGVRIDGSETSTHHTIPTGSSEVFSANESIYIRTNNALHLELEYNGQTITNFSGGFDVYNLDFTTTGYSGYDDNHRPPSELLGTAGNQPQ